MQKIKTATLTFHASHNYGSMLQAYALQQILISELGVNNEIINFRSSVQKNYYQSPENKKKNWKSFLLKFILGDDCKDLKEKYNLFERFLQEKLVLSKEFNDESEVENYAAGFDFLISGSDQIWNTSCLDFNWVYYLPFAKNNAIAYAPSMGPSGKKQVLSGNYSKIRTCLQQYKAISVREQGTADVVKTITGKHVDTLIDPTLLLCKEQWDRLSGEDPLIKGEYIFMYHPFITSEICKLSQKISKETKLPVLISNRISNKIRLQHSFLFWKNFQYKLDAGPIEFLNLLKNAKYVISGSFHAVVFSIIFNKPFLALHGKTDARMSHLLDSTGLLEYAIDSDDYLQSLKNIDYIDFSKAATYIEKEKLNSLSFIKRALNLY